MTTEVNARVRGEVIAKLRNEKVMSRRDLIAKAGVSYSTISNLESGRRLTARSDTIRKIAYGLGAEPTALVAHSSQ